MNIWDELTMDKVITLLTLLPIITTDARIPSVVRMEYLDKINAIFEGKAQR